MKQGGAMQKFRILPKIVIRFVNAKGQAGPTNRAKGQGKSEGLNTAVLRFRVFSYVWLA
jgi:hypothetical protein